MYTVNIFNAVLLVTQVWVFSIFFFFAVGDTLAYFEEDARKFLFPEPRLVPSFSGVDQEVLMIRAPFFPVGSAFLYITLKQWLSIIIRHAPPWRQKCFHAPPTHNPAN